MKGRDSELDAVVLDFDGVIVNTEPLHFEAFREVLRPLGLAFSWEAYTSYYLGFDDRDAFREAFKKGGRTVEDDVLHRLIGDKARAFRGFVEQRGVESYPGVLPLIRSLSGRVPIALCSGALAGDIEPIIRKLDLGRVFDVVVTADDVEASKPDPASYLLVLKRLAEAFPARETRPRHCVAIEDTPAGIEAASAAGLTVLAVCNSYGSEKLSAAARVVNSLRGITIRDLAALTRG